MLVSDLVNAAGNVLQRKVDFNIVSQTIETALVEFSHQANVSFGIAGGEQAGPLTVEVKGLMTVKEGLNLMFSCSNISFSAVGTTIAVNLDSLEPPTTKQHLFSSTLARQETKLGEETRLEEVIVSIERRDILLQRYAGTAASISSDRIAMQSIHEIENLNNMVPGLLLGTQDGSVEVYIRGVGSNNNTEIGDPAVATHIDGIYNPRPTAMATLFHDIERVEVSIGPQGTIRGRNATAGTINVVTRRPDKSEFAASLAIETGNYDHRVQSGVVNFPLFDNGTLRLSGISTSRDSYFENKGINTNVDLPGRVDSDGIRAQFLYDIDDVFSFLFTIDRNKEEGSGYATSRYGTALGETQTISQNYTLGIGNHPVENLDPFKMVWSSAMSPSENTSNDGQRMEFHFDLTPWLRSELYLSNRRIKNKVNTLLASNVFSDNLNLSDPMLFDHNDRYIWDRRSSSKTAELRFSGESDSFHWNGGFFWYKENRETLLASTDDRSTYFWGQEFNNRMTIKSSAFYFDATYDFSNQLSISAGFRRTKEEKVRRGGAIRLDFPGWHPAFGGCLDSPQEIFNNCYEGQLDGYWGDTSSNRYGSPGWFLSQGLSRNLEQEDSNGDGIVNNNDFSFDELLDLWIEGVNFSNQDTVLQAVQVARDSGVSESELAPIYVDQSGEAAYDFNDFRLRLAWEPHVNSLFYASVSTGHKSGGFNDQMFSTGEIEQGLENNSIRLLNTINYSDGVFVYKPEKLTAFEFGSKNVFSSLTLNASTFYYDYKDQQFSALVTRSSVAQAIEISGGMTDRDRAGDVLFTFNIPNSEVIGLQLEGILKITESTMLSMSTLYLDTKITSDAEVIDNRFGRGSLFQGSDTTEVDWDFDQDGVIEFDEETFVANIKGKRMAKSPELTVNLSLSQSFKTRYGELGWLLAMNYQDEYYLSIFNGEGINEVNNERSIGLYDRQKKSTTYDLGMYLSRPGERVRIEGYVNNLSDERVATAQLSSPYALDRWYQPPRTYGLRLALSF